MNRLVVNPGTPQAWEIQLKPGANSFGHGDSNDFTIADGSVSGSHCQIVVNDGSVTIKDLGSTNGTFVNQAPVKEAQLEPGQRFRLGSVEMEFFADGAPAASAVRPAAPRLRISGLSAAPAEPAVSTLAPPEIPAAPSEAPAVEHGARFCKFHPKAPARYLCNKCNRTFCDMCVSSRNVGGRAIRTCRSCGVECVPLQVQQVQRKGFYAGLPGAFVYPFKGAGIIILICATLAFSALNFVSLGLLGIFIKISLYGFVFLFMQNIILTTASDENEPLGFPDASSLFGAAFQLGGTIVASFWLAIGLEIAKLSDVPIPVEAIMASFILGGIYFPMAFLAVAMKDSVAAANPLVVIPAMLKVPAQYLITVVLLLGVFGIRQLGGMFSGGAGKITLTTKDMSVFFVAAGVQALWALASVYLLTVTMRILGLFYNASKEKLGWFSH